MTVMQLIRTILYCFFSLTRLKYGSLTKQQGRLCGVVGRVRICQVSSSDSIRAGSFIIFLQNLALELGLRQQCTL